MLLTSCTPVNPLIEQTSDNKNPQSISKHVIESEISIEKPTVPENKSNDIELAAAKKPLTAYQAANKLRVDNKAATGYKRAMFGSSWVDTNKNKCDTRNDILAIQLGKITKAGKCTVTTGIVYDPYTLKSKNFKSGAGNNIDIDHVVALSDAYKTGANKWNYNKKVSFANDPLNLLAVDAGLNRYKGDKSAATWLPSHGKKKAFSVNAKLDCPYVARQVAVKTKYALNVTKAEKANMLKVLSKCSTEKIPTGVATASELSKKVTGKAPAATVPVKKPSTPTKPKPSTGKTDPNMGTCKAAKAKGYGPYKKGVNPEYNFYRDGDKDGWVCE